MSLSVGLIFPNIRDRQSPGLLDELKSLGDVQDEETEMLPQYAKLLLLLLEESKLAVVGVDEFRQACRRFQGNCPLEGAGSNGGRMPMHHLLEGVTDGLDLPAKKEEMGLL